MQMYAHCCGGAIHFDRIYRVYLANVWRSLDDRMERKRKTNSSNSMPCYTFLVRFLWMNRVWSFRCFSLANHLFAVTRRAATSAVRWVYILLWIIIYNMIRCACRDFFFSLRLSSPIRKKPSDFCFSLHPNTSQMHFYRNADLCRFASFASVLHTKSRMHWAQTYGIR